MPRRPLRHSDLVAVVARQLGIPPAHAPRDQAEPGPRPVTAFVVTLAGLSALLAPTCDGAAAPR